MSFSAFFAAALLLASPLVAQSPTSIRATVPSSAADLLPSSMIMPWFCLQRCGANVTQVVEHIHQAAELSSHDVPALNTIAFERYNLGPNSTLVFNLNLFDINSYILKNATLTALFPRRIAMVSSFPYPPQFLDWMRELFRNPEPFFDAIMTELIRHDLLGLNIDFEPTSNNATAEDAAQYAHFLNALRARLETRGKVLTVAAATWSSIWNLTLIAEALAGRNDTSGNQTLGYLTSMNTYTFEDDVFQRELAGNVEVFGAHGSMKSLVVGLETWPSNFTEPELKSHFALLTQYNICRIAIWDMPLTPAMMPHLANFSKRCTT